jgi:hypothetical protein
LIAERAKPAPAGFLVDEGLLAELVEFFGCLHDGVAPRGSPPQPFFIGSALMRGSTLSYSFMAT